jgi:hypothetical protein
MNCLQEEAFKPSATIRGVSDSIIEVPVTPIVPMKSLLRRSCSDNSFASQSPTSVMTMPNQQQYALSRQKRVTFATGVFQKAAPVRQRLRGMSMEEIDHGVSVPRAAAFKIEDHQELPESPRLSSKSSSKKKRTKSIASLARRLEKVKRQLIENSFEVEVGQNEVNELLEENEILMNQQERWNLEQMGYDTLENSVYALKHKSRKYSSKIKVLQKAAAYFNEESEVLMEQLIASKKQVQRSCKERALLREQQA